MEKVALPMPASLPHRGYAALLRSAVLALAVGAGFPTVAQACGTLTPEGAARRDRQQARWLHRETDLKVRGTFAASPQPAGEEQDDNVYRRGIVTAADGRRFRVWTPMVINCGFPYVWLDDGDVGTFHFKRDDDPIETDEEDRADGVIDNYTFIHFRSGRGK
jgi:hypothetical protein